VDERLVAVEDAVPSGQQVALQPALAEVLREDLQHAPVGSEPLVLRRALRKPDPVGDLQDRAEAVRLGLVGAEHAERLRIRRRHVAYEAAQHPHRLADALRRRRHLDGVVAEVRQAQVARQLAAVRVR
jgi:hypothetical protein